MSNTWKPIEEAPKDGTLVDLACSPGYRIIDAKWGKKKKVWMTLQRDVDGERRWKKIYDVPTHFMVVVIPSTEL